MSSQRTTVVRAFDVRLFIAVALGLIGIFLVVVALADTTQQQLDKAGGLRANLWTGIVLVVVAVIFAVWARLRPMVLTSSDLDADEAAGGGEAGGAKGGGEEGGGRAGGGAADRR